MKNSLLVVAGALLSVVIGCSCENGARRVTLTMENDGERLRLSQGDEVALLLRGNPTTGYRWELTTDMDSSCLRLTDSSYRSDADRIGAGGEFRFDFKAVAVGETVLSLVYKRPWESEVLEEFAVTISVK